MNSHDPISIATASYRAYERKDRAALETLLAPDFHFTSPLDNRLDRASYFERCWPPGTQIDEFRFVHLVADGDRVFITYEARLNSGQRLRNTEIMTVRGGQISNVEVYFGWSLPHPAKTGSFIQQAV